MIKNIKFKYATDVPQDTTREEFITTELDKWMQGFTDEFNTVNGEVVVTIGSKNRYNIELKNISKEFEDKIGLNCHPLTPPHKLQ